jgi:tetratricopeptide (TPR) repeat protein
MTGDLAEGVVPALLQELYVGRRSGTLELARGEERQRLRFRRGHIVNAHTNVVEERLGEMLVRRGLLSEEDLARATEIVLREKRRLGAVLNELGLLNASGLEDAVALHVHEMLAKVFTWPDGVYSFVEEPEEATTEELILKLSTGDLILEAVQAVRDPEVVREALGDLDRVIAPSADPLLRFQQLTLSPADGFVLSRVDGTTSAREIMQLIPLPPEDTQRSLMGLLATGVVEYVRGLRRPRDASRGAPAPVREAPGDPNVGPATPPPESAASPAPAPSAPPASSAPTAAPAPEVPVAPTTPIEGKGAERRQEILDAWDGLKSRNHFEVLGLPRSATEADVKEAYFRLAKRFHPDVHHGASLGDLRDKLEAVFIRLGEAYDVLRDTRKRGDYEQRLGRPRPPQAPAGPEAPVAAAEPTEPERDPEANARAAEVAIRQAEKLYEKAEGESAENKPKLYADAIRLVEPALAAAVGRFRVRGRVTLARCYLRNPLWAKRAEGELQAALREDPKAVDALALLAALYEEHGLRARALSCYRRVLEIDPEHADAARYVSAQAPGPTAGDEGTGGGLLKRLFRK